jgi:hypothetical protein
MDTEEEVVAYGDGSPLDGTGTSHVANDEPDEPVAEVRSIESVMAILDFVEDVALVLAEAIRDGNLSVWDLRLLVKLCKPAQLMFKSLPNLLGELSNLSVAELAQIGLRSIAIIRSFAKALVE